MEQYGFVYLWRDRKHKRYYIGSHWGTETDGYICSSSWMKSSYRRRPHDFTRREIARVPDRKLLLEEEHRWLSKISPEELGTKYYNLSQHKPGHWSANADTRTIRHKISDAHRSDPSRGSWNIGKKQSDEHRRKHSEAKKGRRLSPQTEFKPGNTPWHKGTAGLFAHSEEAKKKIAKASKGRKHTAEARRKISEAQKGVNNDPRSVPTEYEGVIYRSIRSAAKATGKSYSHIRKHGTRL